MLDRLDFLRKFLGPIGLSMALVFLIISIITAYFLYNASLGFLYSFILMVIIPIVITFDLCGFIFGICFVYFIFSEGIIQKEWKSFKIIRGIK